MCVNRPQLSEKQRKIEENGWLMASEWRRSQADERGFLDRLPMYGGRSYDTGSLTVAALKQREAPLLAVAAPKVRSSQSRLGHNAKHRSFQSRLRQTVGQQSRLSNNGRAFSFHLRNNTKSQLRGCVRKPADRYSGCCNFMQAAATSCRLLQLHSGCCNLVLGEEPLGGFPEGAEALVAAEQALVDLFLTSASGVEHGAAAPGREAEAE